MHPPPLRLLLAYVLAGLAFSLTIGVLVVLVVQDHRTSSTTTVGRALLDIVLGAAALGYAAVPGPGG